MRHYAWVGGRRKLSRRGRWRLASFLLTRVTLALIPVALAITFSIDGNVARGTVFSVLAAFAWWRVLLVIRTVTRRLDARKAEKSPVGGTREVEGTNVAIMQRALRNLDAERQPTEPAKPSDAG